MQDRPTISQEIQEEIRKVAVYEDKVRLIALNFYLEEKKRLDDEIETELKKLAKDYNVKALQIQSDVTYARTTRKIGQKR